MAQNPPFSGTQAPSSGTGSITIRCTPENVGEMRKLVKSDPDLRALVEGLQAHGLFGGLRGLSITIHGTPEVLAKGLAAWPTLGGNPEANP